MSLHGPDRQGGAGAHAPVPRTQRTSPVDGDQGSTARLMSPRGPTKPTGADDKGQAGASSKGVSP